MKYIEFVRLVKKMRDLQKEFHNGDHDVWEECLELQMRVDNVVKQELSNSLFN